MPGDRLSQRDLASLLERTSRTFALAIPLLEEPLRREVGLAYLLFRIADTLEDAPLWGRERRATSLVSFARWLEGERDGAEWKALVGEAPPTTDDGCVELLARADDVLDAVLSASGERAGAGDRAARAIVEHTRRTALGMTEFVRRQDERGGLVLTDIDDLRRYAYVVAGIVGELLTDLFAASDAGVARARAALDADAAAFGEGLQLVNILKDAGADAHEGRSYLPPGVARAEVVALARADLARASRYVATLVAAGAPSDIVEFCDLPARLAVATLDRLDDGGSKLAREEVLRIFAAVTSR